MSTITEKPKNSNLIDKANVILETEAAFADIVRKVRETEDLPHALRTELTDTAWRLLELHEKADLNLGLQQINQIGETYDVIGEPQLVEKALELSPDKKSGSEAIAVVALRLVLEDDASFEESLRVASQNNENIMSTESRHVPLGPDYDFVFDRNAVHPTKVNHPRTAHRPLFKD